MQILKFIKHSFVPTRQNSWQPYLIRMPALVAVTASLLLLQVVITLPASNSEVLGATTQTSNDELVELTNNARKAVGARELIVSNRLQAAAEAKVRDMLQRNYWSHTAPDGSPPWLFLQRAGYDYTRAGENLARDFRTSQGVMQGWLQSDEHRNNLLDNRFEEIGIATATGQLFGKQTTLVVAYYGVQQGSSMRVETDSERGEVLPAVTAYSWSNPLLSFASLPVISQLAALSAAGLSSIYLMQHLIVKKHRLIWDTHVHPRPLFQGIVLLGLVLLLLSSGWGVVG